MAAAATGFRPYRVLIVDDQKDIRELLRTRLGFEDDIEVIGEARNGLEAIALCSALRPDAAVLDLEMPVMRGDQAIPLMREVAQGIRILMYSGASNATLEALAGGEAEPDYVIKKGSPLKDLVSQLRTLLNVSLGENAPAHSRELVLTGRSREIVPAIAAIITAAAAS